VSVEPAKQEEQQVDQQRSVMTSRHRHLAEGRVELNTIEGMRVTMREEGGRRSGVLRAVVPTGDEKPQKS
jgi:hypothetical protein